MTTLSNDYDLDKKQLRCAFERAAGSYDEAAVLQKEVAARMADRLDLMRTQPEMILDAGCGTGFSSLELASRYPGASITGLDIAVPMLHRARARDALAGRFLALCGDMEDLPLADNSVDMIFSNLALQWCADLDRTLHGFCRVLRPGGLLLFTSFGPDTLQELRASWAQADGYVHVNAFIDMHDIGDALMRAGLAEPVMDTECFTLTYRDAFVVMRDLKALGAHNANLGRPHGLTGRRRFQVMLDAYESFRRDGLLPASYEVIHGHAWAPAAGGVHVALPAGVRGS